jgi:tetratricopeptide (TPR) repeat protein
MDAEKKPKPQSNMSLRRQREIRNFTLQEVADKLYEMCVKEGRECGISADTVGRWERGISQPEAHYRAKLCELFGKSTTELGLKQEHLVESSQTPPPPFPSPRSPLFGEESYNGANLERGEPPAVQEAPVVLIPTHQAIDLLRNTSDATPEQKLGALLALEANELATFFDEGWSVEELLAILRVVLPGARIMSKITRRTFGRTLLKLGTAAMLSGIPIPEGRHVSAEELTELHSALSECIQAGWKLFVTASMPQILVVGQAQLHLLHQCHTDLYPSLRPLFYSPVYRLIGAALFFQARYAEAMQAHTQAYLTALEACDPWNMAESLGWQAGVLKACGKQAESIQTTEAALRLLGGCHDSPMLASRARFLAHWAESAALLGERTIMEEKLSSSAELLAQFEGNDEFDAAIWQLYRGTCALYIGDSASADTYLEQALHDLKPNLLHQRASAVLLQAQARLKMGNMKGSLEVVRTAVPLVVAADSPLLDRGLIDQIEQLTTKSPGNTEVKSIVKEVQQYPRLCAFHAQQQIPRYLEAKL